jgi:glycolate oxidase iron-sulfur subunit
MRTNFRAEQLLDPHIKDAEHALRTCVHCGFCTATCPTYLLLGDERDGPRGRITLIQHMLESTRAPTKETVTHLDRCLSCLGCRTACPSGVDYPVLIDQARAHIEQHYRRPAGDRLFRSFLVFVLTRPRLFAALSVLGRIFAPLLPLVPGKLGVMAKKANTPRRPAKRAPMPPVPANARRVLLLAGCVQQVLAAATDASARRVLARAHMATEPVADAGCCGALAFHLGKVEIAKKQARRVIAACEAAHAKAPAEAVLITASGCAAFLKDYGRVFAGDPQWEARAKTFAAKVRDFTELVDPAPPAAPHSAAQDLTIAYHPPCSLQHGQRIHGRGEALLKAAGFRLVPIPDAHLCCGSAGSYSLLQPAISEQLRRRKIDDIRSTGANIIASDNVGCLTHLGGTLPGIHIAELLDWAGGGPEPELGSQPR